MNLIKFRVRFLFWSAVICVLFFGLRGYKSYTILATQYELLNQSAGLRNAALDIDPKNFNRDLKQQLQEYKKNITEVGRAENISDLIQAYSNHDAHLVDLRRGAVMMSEKTFYQKTLLLIEYWQKRFILNLILAAVGPILAFSLLVVFLKSSLFKPLRQLTNRMMDFLVDRYSFQFSQPVNNEMGSLQRTFNSLAERVINNMDELKSLDQAKSEFLSIASHELRTPMTSIKGSLSLLASGIAGPIEPAARKLIEIAETETDRLIRLINDLLDLAKIEARRLPLNLAWVRWHELASKTAEGLSAFAYNAKVQLIFEASVDYELYIDRDRIQQVLTNLISNAVKFSPEGGKIYIRPLESSNQYIEIQVQDEGPGIVIEDQELIFQKFRQAANAENPIVKGTGLGLAIAKALVEEHKGTIGVFSKRDHGAMFYFSLPEWRKQPNAATAAQIPEQDPSLLSNHGAKARAA
jgi:signal transduction histidine kinase